MRKVVAHGAVLLSAAALIAPVSAAPQHRHSTKPPFKSPKQTMGLPVLSDTCPYNIGTLTKGWFKVFLPRRIDFAMAPRKVKSKAVQGSVGDPDNDNQGVQNDPAAGGSHAGRPDPFHLYVKPANFPADGSRPYVAVRVILPKQSDYSFGVIPGLTVAGVPGVAAVEIPSGAAFPQDKYMCVSTDPQYAVVTTASGRKVATFFIDTSKLGTSAADNTAATAAGYNIILSPTDADETPIILDPKIYNDG